MFHRNFCHLQLIDLQSVRVEFISRKNANCTTNNGMYIKRDNVRIKRIILDLRDVIADLKKVLFEYEMPLLS